jgi:hypothetical protein
MRDTRATVPALLRSDSAMGLIANNDKEALGITEDVPIALRARMTKRWHPQPAESSD